jgi:hypothetical protein
MHSVDEASNARLPESLSRPSVGRARLGVGLAQGLVLYLLYRAGMDYAWPASVPLLFVPLLLVALLVPVILASSLGHMNRRQVLIWVCTAAAIVAALGFYDIWRVSDLAAPAPYPSPADGKPIAKVPSHPLTVFLVVGFFIAHSLVLAGVRERRRIASYESHFEIAWKLIIQLGFSAAFVGVVWMVLQLGAELFMLVKLDFLRELTRKSWFVIPVITFAFSCAMHLTDVRPVIVQGIRTLLLVLMSWVLPVITLIVGAFILSLPFTGLAPLWATRHAGVVLLGAAGAFVVLINAAWQDGTSAASVARLIRASARVASLLLVPIVAIAIRALALRVGDYGWTVDRVIAAACLLVASCYAAGYAGGALRRGGLGMVPKVNVATAFVVLATLLLLFSPLADPARLSVNNQVARLSAGKVPVAKFDFAYLRFEGARYGRDALARLEAGATGRDGALIRERIATARKLPGAWHPPAEPEGAAPDVALNLRVWPTGTRLPERFLKMDWRQAPGELMLPECLREKGKTCDAYVLDLGGDSQPEIIVIPTAPGLSAVLGENGQHEWRRVASLPYNLGGCASVRNKLVAGDYRSVRPAFNDLDVGGVRIQVSGSPEAGFSCPAP